MRSLVLLLLVSCAKPAPVFDCATTPVATTPVPAPDAALAKWEAIIAGDMRVPAGTTATALVPELVAYLGSVDPVRRDHVAYDVLARWIGKAVLTDAEVRALATELVATLDRGATVFARSFAALVLAEVARRDATAPFLDEAQRVAILAAARAYADRELDLRGHTGAAGWAHAAAHTADLLAQLGKSAALTDEDRATILDAAAAWVTRRHGTILAYGEDGRLAVAVLRAAAKGVSAEREQAFLATLAKPLSERGTPAFDAGLYAAQRNARNLLVTLYTQLSLAPELAPGEARLLASIKTLLAS